MKHLLFALLLLASSACRVPEHISRVKTPLDSLEAVSVGLDTLLDVYGRGILKERPFKAELIKDSVWMVHSTLPASLGIGGVGYVHIRVQDGKIILVSHGK